VRMGVLPAAVAAGRAAEQKQPQRQTRAKSRRWALRTHAYSHRCATLFEIGVLFNVS
jgi:hypothetical protein